ncbi:MAG: Holliday junction branch migration protein RuvA [Gammaproteobacteria bacterium]|nr:Holliday junction branch migration protein RuvA [Gammaproteobacteria bacterium]
MIAWLSGKVIDISSLNIVVLDVNGVGYAVETTTPTYATLSQEKQLVNLFIHTIVREDAINLYGFIDQEERALFKALIKVNGIGPKSAIGILSSINPSMFVQCIEMQDKTLLTKLPGVGKKTADRILIEMQDILKNSFFQNLDIAQGPSHTSSASIEAIAALEALGYRNFEAKETVKSLEHENQDAQSLIKASLKKLAKY